MTARSLALLLSDLGVTESHARHHVPDDTCNGTLWTGTKGSRASSAGVDSGLRGTSGTVCARTAHTAGLT